MLVTINGEKYVAESIKQFPVNPLADAFRVTGVQQRSDNVKLNRYSFSNWNEVGIGVSRLRRQRQNSDGTITGQHIGAMRDADAETRFANAITLPLLNQTETHTAPLDHLISYEHFKGDLYGFFENDYVSGARGVSHSATYAASSDTWTAKNTPQFNAASTANAGGGSGAATVTFAHTVQSAKADRLIMVKVGSSNTGSDPTGVTYAGAALAKLDSDSVSSTSASIWWKVAPATGSNNVVVTYSGAQRFQAIAEDWWDVNQSAAFGTPVSGTATATSISVSVTATRGDIVTGVGFHVNTNATTPGALQTERADANDTWSNIASSDESAPGTTVAHSYSWSGSNLTIGIGVPLNGSDPIAIAENDVEGVRLFSTTVHKGALFAVGSRGSATEDDYWIQTSTDGTAWTEVTGSSIPTADYIQNSVTRSNDWSQKYADIMSDGDNLIVALYEDPDSSGGSISQVRIGYSTNSGAGWDFNAGLIIPCTDTPNIKLLHFNDLYTAGTPEIPILVTSDNIYKLDIGNNVFQEFLPQGVLSGTAGEALAADVGVDGNLYISKKSGDILQISFPQQGNKVIQNIGPKSRSHFESNDGLVLIRQGYATYIDGSDPVWLFVGYGGEAGSDKKASIFAMNYVTGAWHSFYLHGTANEQINTLVISTEDDGTARLHADATSLAAAASTAFMFEEPLVSAATGVIQNYKTTGYVEWAEDDLGDPHTSAAVMRAFIDDGGTMGSGDTTNYVQLKYGLDGDAHETVTLGNFFSTAKSLNFDTSNNRGISAKTLKVRLNLEQKNGDTTETPQIKEYEVQARNRVSVLRGWEIAIDLDASAEFQSTEQPANPETVVSNLLTVQNSVTLVGLTVGEGAEAQVEMTTGEWMLELIDVSGGDGLQSGRVSGRALVVLEEVR